VFEHRAVSLQYLSFVSHHSEAVGVRWL